MSNNPGHRAHEPLDECVALGPTVAGMSAMTGSGEIMIGVSSVAPIISTTRPVAASGVRLGRMRASPGRSMPTCPAKTGVVLIERRIDNDSYGFHEFLDLLAQHGNDQCRPIPVAIETPRGLVVACLRRTWTTGVRDQSTVRGPLP